MEFPDIEVRGGKIRDCVNEIVGNVHFNRIWLDVEKLDLHKSDHEKGVELLMSQLKGQPYRIAVEEGRCRILIISKCF